MRHLDNTTLDGYLSRSLGREQLRALDDHVASCLDCTLTAERAGLDEDRWERRGPLGRLTRVMPERGQSVAVLPARSAERFEPARRRAS
jgi:hypothetical protein